jgi:hypothetical protein
MILFSKFSENRWVSAASALSDFLHYFALHLL